MEEEPSVDTETGKNEKDHENCRLIATPNQSRWTHLQPISCCTLRTASPTQLKPPHSFKKASPPPEPRWEAGKVVLGVGQQWKRGPQKAGAQSTADKRTRHATQPDLRV